MLVTEGQFFSVLFSCFCSVRMPVVSLMCRDCGGQLPRSLAISWGVGAVGGWHFTGKLGPWSRRCTVSHCSLGGGAADSFLAPSGLSQFSYTSHARGRCSSCLRLITAAFCVFPTRARSPQAVFNIYSERQRGPVPRQPSKEPDRAAATERDEAGGCGIAVCGAHRDQTLYFDSL